MTTDTAPAAAPAFQLPEGLTVEMLLSQYGAIGDQLDTIEAEHKAKTAGLSELRDQITAVVHKYMLAQNLQNTSAGGRTAFFTTVDWVKVESFETILIHMLSTAFRESALFGDDAAVQDPQYLDAIARRLIGTGAFELLTKAVKKDTVKEYMKENGDIPPPGVGYGSKKELRIQKR